MKKVKKYAAALALLSFAVSGTAYADVYTSPHQSSYERERSAEEWAKLRDDIVEWDELQDLVHEYNPTVSDLWISFRENDREGAYSLDYDEIQEMVEAQYEALRTAAQGNEIAEAFAGLQYQTDTNRLRLDSSAQASDRELARLSVEQTEKTMTESIRSGIIALRSAELNRQIDELSVAYNQTLYEAAIRRQNAGQSTQLEVLTAKETLEQSRLRLASESAEKEKAEQKLRVSLGWKYNAAPVFPELPKVSAEMIAALSPEADTESALKNSYSLRMTERKRSLSQVESSVQSLEASLRSGQEGVRSDMLKRYQELLQASHALEQARLSAQNARESLARTERNYAAGTASARALEGAQYQAATEERKAEISENALLSAYYTYLAGRDGLSSGGAA